jgi:hypothetical protein
VLSVHDVCPAYEAEFLEWRARLDDWGVARRSLAVIPFFGGRRLSDSPRLAAALQAEAAVGAEVVLHGWEHRFEGVHATWRDRTWSRLATRGCEEFAGLTADEAEVRMRSGLAELAAILPHVRIEGFTAPGWWHSAGTLEAAARLDLRFVTGLRGVWDVRAGRWLAVPVLTGLPLEAGAFGRVAEAWGWAWLAARRSRAAGLALHPYDLRNPGFLARAKKTLRAYQARSVPFRLYRELLTAG